MRRPKLNRRQFHAVCAAAVSATAFGGSSQVQASPTRTDRRLLRSVKWGMIEIDGPPIERFRVCKELGFDGIELISPVDIPIDELRAASVETGLPIHGVVNNKHWQVRLASPDESTRDRAVAILDQAVQDCHAMGGHSVLLLPGVVGEEATHAEVWSRSIEGIRRVLPSASRLGVHVLIENVWNGFCETPEQLRDYLDEISSPWVGSYYDVGNSQRFSPTENWIRVLGSRIVKLDVKDWGVEGGFGKIGDGDVDWPAVREALQEIGFSGWCTAEVEGGNRSRLADVAWRMDNALGVKA